MRTIRRVSARLNRGKVEQLQAIARAYAAEKQQHLEYYHQDAYFAGCANERKRRDELVKARYQNRHRLRARMWKMAQKDAYEVIRKSWASLAQELRPRIAAHEGQWSEEQQIYAYWLLRSPRRMAQLVCGRAPMTKHFKTNLIIADRRQVQNYLRRVIRRDRGARPVVRMARSFALDEDMYRVSSTEAGRQVISVMNLEGEERVRLPLEGNTPISGNIRVVLDVDSRQAEVHFTARLKLQGCLPDGDEVCALDAGLTEVFTDENGERYGMGFGKLIYDESNRILTKNRKRNKLYQLAEQYQEQGKVGKADNIRKFNLGRKKQNENKRKKQAEMTRQINMAFNQVLATRHPAIIVTEKLDIRGKAKSRKMSRQVSLWPRGILKERVEFKASAARCSREQVNPAYSSQMCPQCWFVHDNNRQGDRFQCLHCGYVDDADRVAAINLKARRTDPDIKPWTPKGQVRSILLERFNARL